MKRLTLILLLSVVFLLVGCADDPVTPTVTAVAEVVETATRPQTATPTPSSTFTPLPTATATNTATSTSTPSPTATPLPTATATGTPTSTPTPTPVLPTATARPASLPASGSPPAGPNLLINPGFENGEAGWEAARIPHNLSLKFVTTYSTADHANFVRSGQRAAHHQNAPLFIQFVTGVTVGTTYRFGAWGKLWSSTGSDRTLSENPETGLFLQVCIGTEGTGDPSHVNAVCSAPKTPLDTWQYLFVDAVANSDRIVVMLFTNVTACCRSQNGDALWDDTAVGLSPAAATATPPPYVPVRPNPVPFNGVALRDNMLNLRTNLQNLGGLLDRLAQGQGGTCEEFFTHYNSFITTTTYEGIPNEWQGIYNDYLYAADHAVATNESLNSLCTNGGGAITGLNYGVARTGVNESVDRLSPAIEAANGLLGQ